MVIVLIDGKILYPKGKVEQDVQGVRIEVGNDRHLIPMTQIKWIYENPSFLEEEKFIKSLNKFYKPITNYKVKTYDEMINNLYGDNK